MSKATIKIFKFELRVLNCINYIYCSNFYIFISYFKDSCKKCIFLASEKCNLIMTANTNKNCFKQMHVFQTFFYIFKIFPLSLQIQLLITLLYREGNIIRRWGVPRFALCKIYGHTSRSKYTRLGKVNTFQEILHINVSRLLSIKDLFQVYSQNQ